MLIMFLADNAHRCREVAALSPIAAARYEGRAVPRSVANSDRPSAQSREQPPPHGAQSLQRRRSTAIRRPQAPGPHPDSTQPSRAAACASLAGAPRQASTAILRASARATPAISQNLAWWQRARDPSDIGVHKRQKTVIRAPLREEQLIRAEARIERAPDRGSRSLMPCDAYRLGTGRSGADPQNMGPSMVTRGGAAR